MKLERDFEIVLDLIRQYSGKITWYPLARKTKMNINGVLNALSERGLITSFKVMDKKNEREYFSITKQGEDYFNNEENCAKPTVS